jgi:3-hydroxymyristoyl/3-hydroxydecanoyl-(acyl carrier protein) dehydratase
MPVLPAVCEIQAALAMLEERTGRKVGLREIVVAKFTSPVTCGERLVYSCSVAGEDGGRTLMKANVTREGEQVAEFRLRIAFEGEALESR